MAKLLYLAGEDCNHLQNGSLSMSPAGATGFLVDKAVDHLPIPLKWGSDNATMYLQTDNNMISNPDLDTNDTGWTTTTTTGSGSVSRITGALARGGSGGALLITAGTGSAYVSRDFTVRAGDYYQLDTWLSGHGAANQGQVFIQNLRTLNFYNGSAWAASGAAVLGPAGSAGTYVQTLLAFQIESYQACMADTVTIRITWGCSGAGPLDGMYLDDQTLYPGVNFAMVHGHTIEPFRVAVLASSDNAFANSTTRATFTVAQPSFYTYLSSGMVYARYWRVPRLTYTSTVTGTFSPTPPLMSEAILGQAQVAAASAIAPSAQPWAERDSWPQMRNRTPSGHQSIENLVDKPLRDRGVPIFARTQAEYDGLYQDLWLRSQGGKLPSVIVPDDADPKCYWARMRGMSEARRVHMAGGVTRYEGELAWDEMAFLAVGA